MSLHRRTFLKGSILLPNICYQINPFHQPFPDFFAPKNRVRPNDPKWPNAASWNELSKAVGGKLEKLEPPFNAINKGSAVTEGLMQTLHNPYAIGDSPALTQTLGWWSAWQSEASVYVVAAKTAADVVAAVNFAQKHNLRLVVKGGGHSYQGTSNAKDSLLIWTRKMNKIEVHEKFIPFKATATPAPMKAVSVGAGCVWMQVYQKVTTQRGLYVQGGGCATVGVAGLIQSGGFGSLSKYYGLAASGLLEAEVVTADGRLLTVNQYHHPDLFWALKGGGGGALCVVTKLVLQLHDLPPTVGVVFGEMKVKSDDGYKQLLAFMVKHYTDRLFNRHWGEQIRFHHDSVSLQMMFAGLSQQEALAAWQPLLDYVAAHGKDVSWSSALQVRELPPNRLWDPAFFQQNAPQFMGHDDRPGAPADNVFWAGDGGEAGQYLYGYDSLWLHQKLLRQPEELADALFSATRHWSVSLHLNKGLAGALEKEQQAAKNTAINPSVIEAFALAIISGGSGPAHPQAEGHTPDAGAAATGASDIKTAMAELKKLSPDGGSYYAESSYFELNWQRAHWGANYTRLRKVKKMYDPHGLFFVHHGVGSEEWSADGFTRK